MPPTHWPLMLALAAVVLVPGAATAAAAAEPSRPAKSADEAAFNESEALFDALSQAAEDSHAERSARFDRAWQQMAAQEEARWKKLEGEVLQKWGHYLQSDRKRWVDYSADRESLSEVDFESGEVEIEALVAVDAGPAAQKRAIAKKLEALDRAKDASGKPIMAGMLPAATRRAIDTGKLAIAPSQRVRGRDGVTRKKVSVRLAMVPDHMWRRAQRYLPQVMAQSRRHDVEPALVLAVIEAESAFNPKARSGVPAFGLMQIVPRYAGKEAYGVLYGEQKLPSPAYLYDPDHNVELGVTYLGLLHHQYFRDIGEANKRRIVSICAYNWGPGSVRKRLLSRLDSKKLSAEQLFAKLLMGVPQETHDYLIRVEKKRARYVKTLAARE